MSESWCKPFINSLFSIALYSSRCKSCWVSKPDILQALLTSASSKGWDAWCGHKPLALWSEVSYLWAPSQFQVTRLGRGWRFFCEITSLLLLPILMWLFYPLLWRSCSASFQVILIGVFSMCSCEFIVSMEGDESRTFLHHHPEPPPSLVSIFTDCNNLVVLSISEPVVQNLQLWS